MPNVVMVNVLILGAVMLDVVMQDVVAPWKQDSLVGCVAIGS
jgi:hypothetical protein